jgi:putative oxidoreductase
MRTRKALMRLPGFSVSVPHDPGNAWIDIGLLILRSAGLFLAVTFGRQKLVAYAGLIQAGRPLASSGLASLIGMMGLPLPGFLGVCAVLNESIGALLIACGLLTRLAAAVSTLGMAGALYISLRLGEEPLRAMLYLIIFLALVLTGPGRFSMDYLLAKRFRASEAATSKMTAG